MCGFVCNIVIIDKVMILFCCSGTVELGNFRLNCSLISGEINHASKPFMELRHGAISMRVASAANGFLGSPTSGDEL